MNESLDDGLHDNKNSKMYLSYSQYGDDLIIDRFFENLNIKTPSYLDIGANHPIIISNTYLFYQKGSRGVLIEPNKNLAHIISNARPEDILLSVGIAGKEINKKAKFYVSPDEDVLNSFIKDNIEWHNETAADGDEIELVDINDVISKYFNQTPDFISIDVEGMEIDILRTFDFERFRTKLFCIEIPIKKGLKEELFSMMNRNDYSVMYEPLSYGNVIFIDNRIKMINQIRTY